ncbi:hypothetical protein A0H81_14734 [Grifola frondosa]|uniref:BTB domain-containing protein n=1 Tax=Grifola frondosa TaxID=5627 RepID=A0A1C7LMN0_GRIFR|nr:hypothetical protein A0H81_14734 [Grifola frondosa]
MAHFPSSPPEDCADSPGMIQGQRPDGTLDLDASMETLQRYNDLWFTDGSIILRAENTLFRVHMSQLSRRSGFFRDMFSLPQPCADLASDTDFLEGCPVLRLHDAAEDLINLLKAIYDGPTFGNHDRNDFRLVSGVMRLATKYLIDSLRKRALAHLSIPWPSTLKGWDAREDIARAYEAERTAHRGHRYPSPIDVINLAREVDAPELLPAAFYDLSRYHCSQIFEPGPDEPLSGSTELSLADTRRLALGKEVSQHAVTALIQGMGQGAPQGSPRHASSSTTLRQRPRGSGQICVSAAACRKDFLELVELATQHYLFDRERGCADPLYVAEELGQLKSAEFSECKACAKSLEMWAARERERMWKLIPSWFRLENTGGS